MDLFRRSWVWLQEASHYDEAELMAFHDGETQAWRSRRIAAHLERCRICQGRVGHLEQGLKYLARIDPMPLEPDTSAAGESAARLQRALRTWNARFRETGSSPSGLELTALCPEMCAELGFYLGSHAVDLIYWESIRKACSRKELREALESVLQNFLGYQASRSLAEVLPPLVSFEPCQPPESF